MARNGKLAEALTSLDQALRLGADPYNCYLRQASLYQSLGQPQEAVSAAQKAVDLRPDRVAAREAVVALLLELRDFRKAVEASEQLLRINPRHIAARDAMGAAYLGLGDTDAALRIANEVIRREPNQPMHRLKRAFLFEHNGEVRLAMADLQRAMDMSDDLTLVATIREHLDALDSSELAKIVELASNDAVFRAKLLREPERTILERGFALTDWGLQRLREMAAEGDDTVMPDLPTRLYH